MNSSSNHKPIILAIDDAPQNLELIDELLSPRYVVRVASHGVRGLKIARAEPRPDLILLDVIMPDMDGYEVCKALKADHATRDIPVIFLTSKTQVTDEQHGLELGAVDYITKPISPPILELRVRTQLMLKSATDFLRDRNVYLEQEVARRTEEVRLHAERAYQHADEIKKSHEVTLVAMASIAEARDNETGYHLLRTQNYIRRLAEQMSTHTRFAGQLDAEKITLLYRAAPLHDIGKVGIPDRILLKPGKLTAEEFEIMKKHAAIGHAAIETAQKRVGIHLPILEMAKEIALCHHEKWDGSGYPAGLHDEAIPLSARLMAIADVYDALLGQRIYKPALTHDEALGIIVAGRGSHFDPDLTDGLLAIQDDIRKIAADYTDRAR